MFTSMYARRQARIAVLEALERRVKQFRSHDRLFTFRVPHEPLDLDAIIEDALADGPERVTADDLRSRPVMRMTFADGHRWEAWAIALPSNVHVYCDSDGHETRVLASLRRGNPLEADRFFLELLADTRGEAFGIEMAGAAPCQVRTPVDDREFLIDVFVDLLEGTPAGQALQAEHSGGTAPDFRADVDRWLAGVLIAPPPRNGRRRLRRLRDDERVI